MTILNRSWCEKPYSEGGCGGAWTGTRMNREMSYPSYAVMRDFWESRFPPADLFDDCSCEMDKKNSSKTGDTSVNGVGAGSTKQRG